MGVNVPVIPVNSNLAEKAKAGYWGCVASFRLSDSNRMKLWKKKKVASDVFPSEVKEALSSEHVLYVRVGSNGRVWGELDRAVLRNIRRGGDQLKGSLLLRVSNVDGDLAGTEVGQGRSRDVWIVDPLYRLWLTGLPTGGSDRGSGLHSAQVSGLTVVRKEGKRLT